MTQKTEGVSIRSGDDAILLQRFACRYKAFIELNLILTMTTEITDLLPAM